MLLVGPSGAGKSTLLRAVAGLLLTADVGDLSGSVTIDDEPPQARPGTVGLLLQDPAAAVVAERVGRDVAFGLENLGVPRPEMAAGVHGALNAVTFPYDEHRSTRALSGGELQRLALAGALVLEPSVLLLDEPTAMLDEANAAAVRQAIVDLCAQRGTTLVVVEHRIEAWLAHVDRCVVLDADGAVTADGPARRVLEAEGSRLSAAGVWVPGFPPPEPVLVDPCLVLPQESPERGSAIVRARDVTVRHRPPLTRAFGPAPAPSPPAVSGASADLVSGAAFVLTGPSGAGKSTLLGVLAGLVQPGSGTAVLTGQEMPLWRVPSVSLAGRLAWVPQLAAHGFVAGTVLDEVLATARALSLDEGATQRRARGLLAALGLEGLEARNPHTLSGGEQRRLLIAAALVAGPSGLLLDEPTLGQDRLTWAVIAGLVGGALDAGAAVGVATHDAYLVALLGPRPGSTAVALSRATSEGPRSAGPSPSTRAADRGSEGMRRLFAAAGPLSLLAACLAPVFGAVAIHSARHGAWALGPVLALLLLGVAGWRSTVRRAALGLVAAATIGLSTWLYGGRELDVATGAALRILYLVLPGAVLTAFLDPVRLADHLAQRLRLPHRPVVAASVALQRLDTMGADWEQIRRARRSRGLGADRGLVRRTRAMASMAMTLLVSTLRGAGTTSLAMDARGFATAQRRTWAEPAPWTAADWAVLALGVALAAWPWLSVALA